MPCRKRCPRPADLTQRADLPKRPPDNALEPRHAFPLAPSNPTHTACVRCAVADQDYYHRAKTACLLVGFSYFSRDLSRPRFTALGDKQHRLPPPTASPASSLHVAASRILPNSGSRRTQANRKSHCSHWSECRVSPRAPRKTTKSARPPSSTLPDGHHDHALRPTSLTPILRRRRPSQTQQRRVPGDLSYRLSACLPNYLVCCTNVLQTKARGLSPALCCLIASPACLALDFVVLSVLFVPPTTFLLA